MKPNELPSFAELDLVLGETTLKLHPSQIHGLICGMLCGNPKNTAVWEELIGESKESAKTYQVLQNLYDLTFKQLNEFLFELQLVLPSDTENLPLRAEALTLWCQGMLTGLKLNGVQIVDREPGELTEAIDDLIEIAKMNYEDVVASEEDEEAYSELVEYVRMAVILVYQDLRESETPPRKNNTTQQLH